MVQKQAFQKWFRGIVGTPFPASIEVGKLQARGNLFWVTSEGSQDEEERGKITGLPAFLTIENQRRPYRIFGYWGHGLNSYAFYYTRREPNVNITLRTPFGGVFTSTAGSAERLVDTLVCSEKTANYVRRLCEISIEDYMGILTVKLWPEGDRRSVLCWELKGVQSESFWKRVIDAAEKM